MHRFAKKVAVVTASTDGIGFAIAQRLLREGARVVVSSRKSKNVEKAVDALKSENPEHDCHGLVCHVGLAEDRQKLVAETVRHFGKIDILVSNAATNPVAGRISDVNEEVWDKLFDVNVKSAFFLTKEALPHMNKGSSIVFVSSLAGYTIFPMIAAYSVTKTALLGLTKALSQDLAIEDIRVNAIAPGVIKTRFSGAFWKNESLSDQMLMNIPLHRYGSPEECAGAVAYLCSDDASYVTGEVIGINGGMTSRL